MVEDAAASLGTRINGRLTGTFGDAAFFSFDSTKLVNVPLKAGFLTVADKEIFERAGTFLTRITRPMPHHQRLKLVLMAAALLMLEHHALYRIFHTLFFVMRGRFTEDGPELRKKLSGFYVTRFAEWQAQIALHQLDRLEELVATRRRIYQEYRSRLHGSPGFSIPPEDKKGNGHAFAFRSE